MPNQPIIPAYITVHLGSPDSSAENVTVPATVKVIGKMAFARFIPKKKIGQTPWKSVLTLECSGTRAMITLIMNKL